MADKRFPKSVRLLRASDFDRVFAARASAADATILLYGLENNVGHARLGMAVSRKFGSAVNRNRWKRVVREAFRTIQKELPALDLICLPRGKGAADFLNTQTSLKALSRKIEAKLRKRGPASPCQPTAPGDQS